MKINSKSRKINKAWLNDHVNDPYVKLAQREGYRARAAYKLKEIDEALGLIKPGQLVIDLGSAPGAWSQYLRRRFAPKVAGSGGAASGELHGRIVALDLLDFEPIEGVHFIQGDFRDDAVLAAAGRAHGRPARRRGAVGHGAQPVGHRICRRGAHGPPGRTGGGVRAAAPAEPTARWCARCSTAAATASWSSCSRTASGSSSRSSPRPRATSRLKPFWSAWV